MSVSFVLIALVALMGACAAMTLRSVVHCALALSVAFAGIGLIYLNLGVPFLGLSQLLVYVGAIAVLIVFVIMLTRGGNVDAAAPNAKRLPLGSIMVAMAVFAVLASTIWCSSAAHPRATAMPQSTVRDLGFALMGGYLFPLEVIGLMLTAALIGAVVVAMKEGRR